MYLDLIELLLDKSTLDAKKEDGLASALLLHDVHGKATAFQDLYSSASLPSNIPGLCLPSILDAGLIAHALFKRRKWRLQKFTMAEFLEGGTLQVADEQTRRMFWKWLWRNARHIAPRDRPKLADLMIWPDDNGNLCKISDLCEPRSGRVGTKLTGFIRRPLKQVRRSKLVSVGGRARTSVRRRPVEDEIGAWLDSRLARFEIGSQPHAATAGELCRFEGNLSILLEQRSVAPLLKTSAAALPALARDGSIRLRTELVFPRRLGRLLHAAGPDLGPPIQSPFRRPFSSRSAPTSAFSATSSSNNRNTNFLRLSRIKASISAGILAIAGLNPIWIPLRIQKMPQRRKKSATQSAPLTTRVPKLLFFF